MTHRPARFLDSIAQIDALTWNSLAGAAQPFLRHEFLLAMEESGCTVPRTGWTPQHLVIEDTNGAAGRGHAVIPQDAFSRRVRLRFFLGERLCATRPQVLSKIADGSAVHSGERAAAAAARGRRRQSHDQEHSQARQSTTRATNNSRPGTCCSPPRRSPPVSILPVWFCAAIASSIGSTRATTPSRHSSPTFTAEKRKKVKRERRRVAEAGIEFDTLHRRTGR